MKRNLTLLTFIVLLLSACSMGISSASNNVSEPTATSFVTATLPASRTPRPTSTPVPPSPTNTIVPVTGRTTTKLNVRAEPNTASGTLGILAEFVSVEINGKDPSETWYRINYADSPDGLAWVTARYITVAGSLNVPVIGGGANGDSELTGLLTESVNVRSGPGTSFNSLGLLNANDVITLTGKNGDATWLQIEYPTGPEGKGWVAAAFVDAQDIESLPIVTDEGAIVGTGTPTTIPATPTATIVPAPRDNDSKDAPLADVALSPTGNRSFLYSGDVSAPQGDSEDWIQWTVQAPKSPVTIYASLVCLGSETLSVDLWLGSQVQNNALECGDSNINLSITANTIYLFQLSAPNSGGNLLYTAYRIKISLEP